MEQFRDLQIPVGEIASNTFHKDNILGGGGFGMVYKGELSRFTERGVVAFKKLNRKYGQGETEFFKEIQMLSQYKHENIITLLGYCMEGNELILVYEYASNGSLDSRIGSPDLTWIRRLKICLQAAKGLRYLHDPNKSHLRVIHRDIKSANILLDDEWNAKVSDFGLSKITPENANLVTYATGTTGYSDPQYYKTYSLTEKSDVYSFGVTLFEVLCGRLCYEVIGKNELLVFVRKWMKSYEQKKIKDIVFKELDMKKIDESSLKSFSDIAYKCLNESREERPTMAEVVTELEVALEAQEHYDMILKDPQARKCIEIVRAAVSPVKYRSIEELKERLSEGVLINEGKTWFSISEKGEHYGMISIQDCLIQDDPSRDYSDQYSFEKNSRFEVGCYKTRLMEFKLHVRTPLFLSPDVTYGLNLVFHYSEKETMKQQHVGVRYQLLGEKKISILCFADKREDKQLVAELYQFTSNEEGIQDLEILLEDCGLLGDFYIEGIEFQPLKRVEHPVVVTNEEIFRAAIPPLFYGFTEVSEVLLSQGVLLNKGRTWFSMNEKEEHCLMLSIEDCLIRDDPNRDYSDEYSSEKDSRFVAGCYQTRMMKFKIRVTTPLFLSPHVTYGVNLIFQYSKIEGMKRKSFPVMYKLLGETKISLVNVADMREDGWLVATLYHFTTEGDKSILNLEIIFEDCGLSGYFYIEGIEFQPLGRVEHPVVVVEYEEILNAAATPLFYRSTEELKQILTNGILLNGGKTLLCLNDKGQHIERIFIEACLDPDQPSSVKHLDDCVNSRFPGGRCYNYYFEFKARVRAEYLTPQISYTLNLVFRYEYEHQVNSYNPLRYKIDGEDETKVFIIYPTIHEREDEWFIAPLYQFTSQHKTADLQFVFDERSVFTNLLVAGIEFQPYEEKVELPMFEEYQDIIEATSQSLFYTSLDELKQILSKGVHLNGYKTWFSLNEKGDHCHMISLKDCLIPNEDFPSRYKSHYMSRFPAGFYQTNGKGFKTHVKAQFLSPSITYTVNLVYISFSDGNQVCVDLKYRLRGEATTSAVYLANKRYDDLLYMAELYQFTSDGSIVDLEITFENSGTKIDVECILFQPLEIVEDQVSNEDKVENIQTVSDSESDTYWEEKLPNDYEEILNLSKDSLMWTMKKGLYSIIRRGFLKTLNSSKDSLQWTTNKELYSILRRGFLINNGQEWFTIDKHGKKCLMLSARATWVIDDKNSACKSSHESRFGEVLVITAGDRFKLVYEIKPEVLSPDTTYASYFVYKLPSDQSKFECPLKVCYKSGEDYFLHIYSYLVSPPNTPVIGPKVDENKYNPLNRHKLSALPKQRSDGWMEVKVWQFDTWSNPETLSMHLKLKHPVKKDLSGLIIHGIELRPI